MAPPEYTPEEIEAGIVRALEAQDVRSAVSLLEMLAVRDPDRAELIYDTMNLGIGLRRAVGQNLG